MDWLCHLKLRTVMTKLISAISKFCGRHLKEPGMCGAPTTDFNREKFHYSRNPISHGFMGHISVPMSCTAPKQ